MSAVSGLTSKGENKSKQKYQSLNINNLYKGKSLENPKTSVAPKHGLQTLGKVGAGRRMPPPANLPSLKSQHNTNPNITLVPTGGQGWGKEEDSIPTPPLQSSSTGQEVPQILAQKPTPSPVNPLQTSSTPTTGSGVGPIASGLTSAALSAAQKSWSTITAIASEASGPEKNFLAQQSPFFPQEFPKLDGGNAPTDATTKASPETSYGPGPSLRPQTEGSWGRGTLPQPQPGFNPNANQPQNAGNGVGGQPASPPLPNDQNVQNIPQVVRGLYPQPMSGLPQQRAPIPGSVPGMPSANQSGAPLMPGQTPMNFPNQYRMMTPYPPHMAYPRGAYPGNAYPPQGYAQSPHGGLNTRQPYFPDARVGQQFDDENGGRPNRPAPPIITDKDLKGFDEILDNEVVQSGWAAANTEIDYNAKLVFSDDEDSHPLKEPSNGEDFRETDGKPKDWDRERREYEREERHKYRAAQQQWPQHMHTNAPNARSHNPQLTHFEHTQPQPQPPPQSAQYARPPPQQIQANYPNPRHNRSEPMVADDDEMWRQRSRQQSDEMAAAVIRARQRREEEEKKIERSRQAAHEKLKAMEERDKGRGDRDRDSIEFDECSRHSSDSRDEKLSNRDPRDSRSSNFSNSFNASAKQYPKNVPPRFQKQAELMRQTQGGQSPQSPPYEQRVSTHSSKGMPSETDVREMANFANNSQPPMRAPLMADSSRSDSQISSGHESIDGEGERRTPEYESKDRRQRSSHSGSDSNNWRAIQRHPPIDSKDSIGDKDIDKNTNFQRDVSSRVNEENDYLTQKSRLDSKEIKSRDELSDSKEIFSDKRVVIERQESCHSDKRSTSSKDERKRYERLDWAAEYDNMLAMNSYGQKREYRSHRHVPITQKQFESIITEPAKKNFTPLRKMNSSNIGSNIEDSKESSVDKPKDLRKSETPPLPNQTLSAAEIVSQMAKPNAIDSSKALSLKDDNRSEFGAKKERESERQFDRNKDKESIKKDLQKEDKNMRKNHSNRLESYISSRGRYAGPAFRGHGREYRRTRGSSEKSSYSESKLISSPGHSRTKSRRKSISDESHVSEDHNRKDGTKSDDKPIGSNAKDAKPDDDKTLSSDTVMSSSASATVMPSSQRSDPSRRGRGVVAFKNSSTRGLPRAYGPSNYGPPPSRAAFGDGTANRSEMNRHYDQNSNDKNNDHKNCHSSQSRMNCMKATKDEINLTSFSNSNQFYDNNRNSISNSRKSGVSANRSAGNTTNSSVNNRSEPLAPRFQRRNNKGSEVRRGGRTRSSNPRSGSANQFESDVTNNEEWETASESSDVADRSDRKSKKSSSTEQRNDSRNYNRKPDNKRSDYPRGQQTNSAGNQSANYRGERRNRNQGNGSNGSTSRSANSNQRNGSIGGSNINDNITVCSLSEVTLDNPNAVEEALSDMKNRSKASSDLFEDELRNSETEDGFQTVSYKKRNRLNQGNDSKKFKHEVSPNSKTAVRTRQSKLAPRFAKQKENIRLNTVSNEAFTSVSNLNEGIKSLTIETKGNETTAKTVVDKIDHTVSNKAVPNAWSRPLSHCSQTTASSPTITTNTKTGVKTINSITHDIQALSVSSKSSSFDQHDSGIDVSDQPPSTASSQRSSPSNDDNKLITTTAKVNTPTDTGADAVTDIDTAKPMCTVIFENTRFKEENKVLAKIAPPKSPLAKDMFVSTTTTTTLTNNVVTETTHPSPAMVAPKKNESLIIEEFAINEKIQSSNVAKVVGMQRSNALSTNVLPTDELNMKIASVKKVWENPSMPSAVDPNNENTKNVLLKTFEENAIISAENHSNEGIHSVKVSKGYHSEQTTAKVDYSSVDSINCMNTTKHQTMTYSTPSPGQMSSQSYVSAHQSQSSLMSSQIMLNTISSPPLAETVRSVSGVQPQFPVHNMATSPAISTPPTMLYNTQVAAHNVYQAFGPQIENLHQSQHTLPAVMAQFAPQTSSGHYGQPLLQHQQNQLNQTNIFMAHQLAQPSAAVEQFKQYNAVAHQQSLAKSLLNNQFVHQNNSTLQQTLANQGSWATPGGHTQANNQTTNYYQQSSVGTTLQAQHFAFQSQPSIGMMSAQPSQAAALVQQSYRATPLSIGRNPGVDANSMSANLRSMFAANIINDMKIATSVNQTLDNRSANRNSFAYSQASNLQQLQQQQQMYANQKYTNRAILPIYAQQMLGQAPISGRPNSASVLSNVNSSNSYTTPIQRPKLNRNNQSYVKGPHPTHHPPQHPQPHQQTPHLQPQHLQSHPAQPPMTQSALSTAQQARMRQEAVRQTQSFFAQSSKNESQTCAEGQSEGLTKDCVNSENTTKSEDKNQMN